MICDLVLIGFGNVGRRFVRLLDEIGGRLAREHDLETRVVGIATLTRGCVYDRRGLDAPALAAAVERGERLGAGEPALRFLRRAALDRAAAARRRRLVVVETTTLDVKDGEPAIRYIRAALGLGAHVVSANKGPAAFAYHALARAAARAKRFYLFESAVLDGVPVFNLQRAGLAGVTITGFRGVVNSTTNYMLTAVERGESFDGALAAMQKAGIAEADPSLDLDGWDAAAKTAVLANVLLGARLTPHLVEREGVTAAVAAPIASARAAGRRVKLIASAERAGGKVRGRVGLEVMPTDDLLAGLEGQQNAIVLQTDLLGEIAIVQRGGGLTQTAYGLVSDLTAIARAAGRPPATRPRPPRARPDRTRSARGRR